MEKITLQSFKKRGDKHLLMICVDFDSLISGNLLHYHGHHDFLLMMIGVIFIIVVIIIIIIILIITIIITIIIIIIMNDADLTSLIESKPSIQSWIQSSDMPHIPAPPFHS